ncbi:hypothetical protein JMUB5695_01286 [Mycobacterium heckeshornense]|nr:hypothetical protein JMUB5695_01286 [Mycobacterium heckeshornense]
MMKIPTAMPVMAKIRYSQRVQGGSVGVGVAVAVFVMVADLSCAR